MSSGQHNVIPSEVHYRELERITKTPWFRWGLSIPKQLSRTHEIPWLGGSSMDLTRIYIDPRFRGVDHYLGHRINVSILIPALIQHEAVEGILLQFGKDSEGKPYTYDGAHELATAAELIKARQIIAGLGYVWRDTAYQDIYKPVLAVTSKPPWANIPHDLNLTPYREDAPSLYRAIEREILRTQVAA